jgi:hypothetical protein
VAPKEYAQKDIKEEVFHSIWLKISKVYTSSAYIQAMVKIILRSYVTAYVSPIAGQSSDAHSFIYISTRSCCACIE